VYGNWYTIPEDLKDVIQEVVNRGTWNSGQPLVVLLISNTDRTENFQSLSPHVERALEQKGKRHA